MDGRVILDDAFIALLASFLDFPATRDRFPTMRSTLCALSFPLCLALPAGAAMQQWSCSLTPASTYSQQTNIALPLVGNWIGNYDAATNPTGTRTIPGLFGGSGNNPIAFSSTVKPKAAISDTRPSGTFRFGFDQATGAVDVANLSLDLLGGQSGTISTSMLLTYSTFRTAQPTSTFIGLTNIEVPVDNGSLNGATALQSGIAVGAATANADGTWNFAVTVPVNVTVSGTALAQPFSSTSPAAIALAGTIAIDGSVISITSQGSVNDSASIPAPPPLVNAPFDLPTVLPAGSVAHLLINGTFSNGTSTTTASSSLVMTGTPAPILGDLNLDGRVNGADLGLMLSGWGQPGNTDLNRDGTTNGADLGLQLSNWTAG
jgi:hypothetical protein